MTEPRESLTLAWIGCCVLVIGTLVYLLDRNPELVPFFSSVSLFGLLPPVFGAAGQSLPTFAHVFALSLLTVAFLDRGRTRAWVPCLSWLAVDAAFEIAQLPAVAAWFTIEADGAGRWQWLLEPLRRYAVNGTFDPMDLVSAVVGAVAAFGLIVIVTTRGRARA